MLVLGSDIRVLQQQSLLEIVLTKSSQYLCKGVFWNRNFLPIWSCEVLQKVLRRRLVVKGFQQILNYPIGVNMCTSTSFCTEPFRCCSCSNWDCLRSLSIKAGGAFTSKLGTDQDQSRPSSQRQGWGVHCTLKTKGHKPFYRVSHLKL